MGEEVAFAWKEEEKMFSCTAKSNPLSPWDEICKHFHSRSREELVCYYFNVFPLQHKACRNRGTITATDEEIGPGAEPVGKGIGHKATNSYTSILIPPKKSRYSYSIQYGTL
ncbi:hypothetical protein V6N13_071114 [Hibiscus sabdariffa]|uniref:SANT domain-containing protein n=1 Tax=Hibiscus sabdariffa TaxID=183260 RepID=A0ABR2TER2_9ROSI